MTKQHFKFAITAQDPHSQARAATINTDHGQIRTPIFMPVGTQATVKGILQRDLYEEVNADIILGNTYHLYLRPGTEILEKAGGLHKFMHWDRPILTDSGGYQVYSLSKQRKITEEGVCFKSPHDGTKHLFTPEAAVDMQRSIGADIIMAFDECTSFPCTYAYAKSSMERTHRWLDRCIKRFEKTKPYYQHRQSLFPIVQGSIYKDLREISARYISSTEQDGYAIGGVCHPTGQLYEVTSWICEILPKKKPRYLMGVGTPKDLLESITLGIDMFDCVMPTRNGRNGMIFTTQGTLNIKNKKWREAFTPLDEGLKSHASNYYTKAYLHHLIKTQERLGAQIATLQNLTFYLWLVRQAREHICTGDFSAWKKEILPIITQRL